MNKFLIIFIVFCLTIISQNVKCQTNWQETFADTNLQSNPTWHGNVAHFKVNTQNELWLNAPSAAANSQLYTQSTAAVEATWEFVIRYDFNPSANNYAKVFLMANAQPNQANQGYFVRVGGSSSDKISLYKKDGQQEIALIESVDDLVDENNVHVRVKVTRSKQHQWQLFADVLGATNYQLLGSAADSQITVSQYFGVECFYTSTRADKFFFDDFFVDGKKVVDSIPPRILAHSFPTSSQLELAFSENIDSAQAANNSNFLLLSSGNAIQSVSWNAMHPSRLNINFQTAFNNDANIKVLVKNMKDAFGNFMADTTLEVVFYRPKYRSVVFNEVFADPDPAVGLPNVEYLELHNTTKEPVGLANWHLVVGNDTTQFSAELAPNGYLLLLSETNGAAYDSLQNAKLPLGNSWLKNSGDALILLDENLDIIDAFSYQTKMFGNAAKQNGGWSLEQINDSLPCADSQNWSASRFALGGTPGRENLPEQGFLSGNTALLNVTWQNVNTVKLTFNRGINNSIYDVIESNLAIDELIFLADTPAAVRVVFDDEITGKQVSIYVKSAMACLGYFLTDTVSFSSPEDAEKGDIALNEILFYPNEGGTDYLEIWNTSTKTIRLNNLRLLQINEMNEIEDQFVLAEEKVLLLPKSYMVFSENNAWVCAQYTCGKARNFRDVSMPSLPTNFGHVAIAKADLTVIEEMAYDADWQHELLNNKRGVALERIHPSLPSNKETSWHSASSAVNFGTPGLENSQFNPMATSAKNIWLNNNSISPNNDGSNDILIVYYDLPLGTALTVKVYGTDGLLVHTISDNFLTDAGGQLTWLGKNNKGQTANSGTYIIMAEWFTPDGNKGAARIPLAVSR